MRKKKSLSRRGRIGRNLLITLLAGILIWLLQGAPPLTAAGTLRRLERESFFTPHSQFQGVLETAWWGPWALGLNDRWLVFGDLGGGNQFYLWPRTGPDDPAVAPQPMYTLEMREVAFAAAGAPEGTASARMTLDVSCWYTSPWFTCAQREQDWMGKTPAYWEHTYQMEGEPLGEGAFAFRFQIWDPELPRSLQDESIQETALLAAVDWKLYQGYYLPESMPIRCHIAVAFFDRAGGELDRVELVAKGMSGGNL